MNPIQQALNKADIARAETVTVRREDLWESINSFRVVIREYEGLIAELREKLNLSREDSAEMSVDLDRAQKRLEQLESELCDRGIVLT